MENTEFKINMQVIITKEQLMKFSNDFICGVFTSWACLGDDTKQFKDFRKEHSDLYLGEVVMLYLLDGNSILVYDNENEEDYWELNLKKLLNGIKMNIEYRNECAFNYEYYDFYDDDRILQFALFGEVLFG